MTKDFSVYLGGAVLGLAALIFAALIWVLLGFPAEGRTPLLFALPIFLALLSAAAWLSYGKSRLVHQGAWVFLFGLALFYVFSLAMPWPQRSESSFGLRDMLQLGLRAQDGDILDLRGLNISKTSPWTRLCFFAPNTSEAEARELAGFRFTWKPFGATASLVLATEEEILGWDTIPTNVAVISKSICVGREKALFRKNPATEEGFGPVLVLENR
jgi:hypothetical protein